jgi:hypothetical protein
MGQLSGSARVLVCGAWVTFTLATTHWITWRAGIEAKYSTDVLDYERIARAAPGLPPRDSMLPQHALHFAPHYLAGLLADVSGLHLHLVYRILALLVLALIAVTVDRLLRDAKVGPSSYVVCMGALLTSPYVFRFDALAPGMLQDACFALGATVLLCGLVETSMLLVSAGIVVMVAGRGDSTVAVIAAALAWLALAEGWRPRRRRALLTTLAIYAATMVGAFAVSRQFSGSGDVHGVESFTLLGTLAALPGSVGTLGSHLARVFVGVTAPVAIVSGCLVLAAVRHRRLRWVSVASLLYATAIVAQTIAMNPGWLQGSQPRLSSFAVAPLVAAAGFLIGDLERERVWSWSTSTLALACGAVVLISLHLHYAVIRLATTPGRFFVLELAGALLLAAPFVWRALNDPAQPDEPGTAALAASGSRTAPAETAPAARSRSSG